MPIKANAKKALRQAKKRTLANIATKRTYKSAFKNALASVGKSEAAEMVRLAQKQLAKAAKKGVIKKTTAARKLSRLMKKVNGAIAQK
ncbi:MAG: 30S ribosomal protein S20 [Candidatus Magasanikbacteria bacterium GW2011_GWA2_56_11]|uniref:Small ribosomal subunit protein bS20 n=1 Tax=Candidatus Magasanikbacteria bacterium GW2011_GWA2_56_11 TaxID=1619044 RepID=A0A0G1YFD9_9BACT|nr:MAG: 30S ribosomal protein S20 [Candidatus Magasanikbacteria bacterium GW2011_GWA2_56_11]